MTARPPTPVAVRDCTCFNLRKAARAVTQLYDEILRPAGLRTTQFSLLAVLGLHAPRALSIGELAQATVMDRTTLTRNLELLEREGLVRIRPGADARVREVSLTTAARDRLRTAFPLWERAQTRMTRRLGAARSRRLLADLGAAIAAATGGDPT